MQSVLVKIVPPAQTPAPCDQRTARVRTTVDLCLDLLAKVLRSATVRSAILREENRVSLGPPAQKSAPCELRGARCDRRNRTACATVCELRAVLCELQSCLSTCLASMLRAAICELRLATGPQLADCGSRIAPRGFAARPSSSVDTMRTCLASILRAAICDVHLADGLLADCGSQNAADPSLRPAGSHPASCDVQRASLQNPRAGALARCHKAAVPALRAYDRPIDVAAASGDRVSDPPVAECQRSAICCLPGQEGCQHER